ncbi:ATP-binding cassette domain-containing protein [Novosphingobium sp.]|uniref:ATP-binding cassette domain-containing protein n=1 Tax=Novosphingobium sp. TaxID=1874826 RepID=UPI00262ECE89|nr:ATP-binding cassette domain-containing protein [Novosphingobium sp.]
MILFSQASGEARVALARIRAALIPAALLTLVLSFIPALVVVYVMLEFSVASPGGSIQTAVGLLLVVLLALGFSGVLLDLRSRVLMQIGSIAVACLGPRLHHATGVLAETSKTGTQEAGQVTADLDAIMQFSRSGALGNWLDLGGVPVLLLLMVVLHVWFAVALLAIVCGFALLLGLTLVALSRPRRLALRAAARRRAFFEENRTRQDTLRALGTITQVEHAWHALNIQVLNLDSAWRSLHLRNVAVARHLHLAALCAMIALGIWLEIEGLAVYSVVIAAGLTTVLALRPLVAAIETAPMLVDARQGWARIDGILQAVQPESIPLPLPAPVHSLTGEQVAIAVPGTRRVLLHNVNFRLEAGHVLAVLGSTGSGKTTLLRALAGAWPVLAGKIRIDGAAFDQWSNEQVGRHIGFLPQSVELFGGTVAENIARFRSDATSEMVVAAAQKALVHDMILGLPEGYKTQVGDNGRNLSGAQAQAIGLARAMLGDPFLLVLDEPTAHCDRNGIVNFRKVVENARDDGKIVVMGGGASLLVELATHVLMVDQGTATYFGETEAVRRAIMQRKSRRPDQSESIAGQREAETVDCGDEGEAESVQ